MTICERSSSTAIKRLPFVLFLGLLCAADAAVAASEVLAAFVLLGQSPDTAETVPMARVIVEDADQACPQLRTSDGTTVMMTPRINPDLENFPVTVCETLIPSSHTAMTVANSTFTLPAVKEDIVKVVVVGDTGCKPSEQTCTETSPTWPFPVFASAAARPEHTPDVVLHMGDYNYSGTPGSIQIDGLNVKVSVYDAGDNTTQGLCKIPGAYYGQNSPGSHTPDSWVRWQADFFSPAKPLLEAAPWVFARGNHELCSRAGVGWLYLLDSNSRLLGKYGAQLSCPDTGNDQPLVLSAPYLVDLGTLNLVVLDSANACDAGLLNSESYINQFSLLRRLIGNAGNNKRTWLQTHRPLWGVDKLDTVGACGSEADKYCYVNQTLQHANTRSPLPDNVELILSGHMHRFQIVSFEGSHAQQLIIGNGGVELSKLYPKKPKKLMIAGDKAHVTGVSQFGFMEITVDKQHWRGRLLGQGGSKLAECHSKDSPICSLEPPT